MEKKRSKQRRTGKSRRFKCNANVKIMKQSKETENNNENSTSVAVVTGQQKEVAGPSKVFKPLVSKSEQKLKNTSFTKLDSSPSKAKATREPTVKLGLRKQTKPSAVGYKIMDAALLQDSISSFAVCGKCKKGGIKLLIDPVKVKYGLAEKYILKCDNCGHEKSKYTCIRRTIRENKQSYFDINVRSVLASQGMGQSSLTQFCSTMGLTPPVTKKPYAGILKHLSTNSKNVADDFMNDAAARLMHIAKVEQPDQVKMTDHGEVAYVPVTVDGTWQRRGHN